MRSFIEQNTSESERDFPVIPDEQASERSVPSDQSVPSRHGGRISYSRQDYKNAYSMRATPSFDFVLRRAEGGYWLVWDRPTGIFGEGNTPLEAVRDFERTAVEHLALLEEERDTLPDGQLWQLDYLRVRVGRRTL